MPASSMSGGEPQVQCHRACGCPGRGLRFKSAAQLRTKVIGARTLCRPGETVKALTVHCRIPIVGVGTSNNCLGKLD